MKKYILNFLPAVLFSLMKSVVPTWTWRSSHNTPPSPIRKSRRKRKRPTCTMRCEAPYPVVTTMRKPSHRMRQWVSPKR